MRDFVDIETRVLPDNTLLFWFAMTSPYLLRSASAAGSLLFFSALLLPVCCYFLAVGCPRGLTNR
jgi:hypothetical protein